MRVVSPGCLFLFIKAMLLEGQFVTVLPRGIVEPEVERGSLQAIALHHPFAMVTEGIIYRAGGVHPPALRALIEAIRAESSGSTGAVLSHPTHRQAQNRRTGASSPHFRRRSR